VTTYSTPTQVGFVKPPPWGPGGRHKKVRAP
jgi:hypothetical protein